MLAAKKRVDLRRHGGGRRRVRLGAIKGQACVPLAAKATTGRESNNNREVSGDGVRCAGTVIKGMQALDAMHAHTCCEARPGHRDGRWATQRVRRRREREKTIKRTATPLQHTHAAQSQQR